MRVCSVVDKISRSEPLEFCLEACLKERACDFHLLVLNRLDSLSLSLEEIKG